MFHFFCKCINFFTKPVSTGSYISLNEVVILPLQLKTSLYVLTSFSLYTPPTPSFYYLNFFIPILLLQYLLLAFLFFNLKAYRIIEIVFKFNFLPLDCYLPNLPHAVLPDQFSQYTVLTLIFSPATSCSQFSFWSIPGIQYPLGTIHNITLQYYYQLLPFTCSRLLRSLTSYIHDASFIEDVLLLPSICLNECYLT